jgi:hypothetical protein
MATKTAARKGPSPEELKAARAAGFKQKKPKKPKSKTLTALEGWMDRFNAWTKNVKAHAAQDKKNKAQEVKRKQLAQRIAGL